jgi:serine palmitoyltransferase
MEQNEQMVHEHAVFINSTVNSVYNLIVAIPGSHLAISYLKNAYQNDPFRIALELFLVFFAIKYMLSKKYKPNDNNVVLTEKVKQVYCLSSSIINFFKTLLSPIGGR